MTKICQFENCQCCFHRSNDPNMKRGKGRPPIQPIDDNHKKCRLCNEIKELAEMRPRRNECILCYNKAQREYYKNNEVYKKYKKIKAIENNQILEEQPLPNVA
jgi:hypothetical protein